MTNNTNYNADSISALEGLDPVRKRPGMYIGSTESRGLHHLVFEIVDNSVDEHVAGYCNHIFVTIEKDGSCTIEDDGRGIPVQMHKKGIPAVRLVLTTLHAGGKFDNNVYKTSSGLHGVGSAVVNALSEHFDVEVYQDGYIHKDSYEKGVPVKKLGKNGLLPKSGKTEKTGTKINFMPDPSIFDTIVFKNEDIKNRLHQIAYLNKGLKIIFEDLREKTKEKIEYYEPKGLISFINSINEDDDVLSDIIQFNGECEGAELEVVMQYTDNYHENILGFCNNVYNSEGGTHLTGFKKSLTTILNQYARSFNYLKDKDKNYSGSDIRNGLTAIISMKHSNPVFEGQTKTKLSNSDAEKSSANITNDQLSIYFDRNPKDLTKVLDKVKESSDIRLKGEKSKNNKIDKNKTRFNSNSKLAGCQSKDYKHNELFIVEGDSAAGSAKMGRNRDYQAIIAIKGKILNVEKATIDKILSNDEIISIINTLGCGFSEGYGNDFNIDNLKYDKIVIMTDADVDGAHIRTLLLTFFYRFLPELVNQGHVYIAMPPLYKVSNKKSTDYLYTDQELELYRKNNKSFNLQRYKGLGEMNADQLWETTMNPETRYMIKVNIEDAKAASSITSALMGKKVDVRRKFIEDNAQYAQLDI